MGAPVISPTPHLSPPTPRLSLLTGGARSGKSALAERLGHASNRPVLFIATMEPADDEVRARIAEHRASRPAHWRTVEAPLDVVAALRDHAHTGDFVILDCLTLWVSNILLRSIAGVENVTPSEAAAAVETCAAAATHLLDCIAAFEGEIAIVTNEVGMGLVPPYPLGRIFRDALGRVNALVAARADRVYYLVAGLALELKSAGALPIDAFGEAPA
ncbi:MAG: bifunctional adenosylcobinamide kinase/adenosylcobinamide-phosphate guanylyltransferase [Chloroflexi bacterium]|nr:bifunctional adenosylcobinamide kinase/adenosylcobinamide-phosphate guanylyltransferase [Chloroflexota bacterium]